MSQVAKSASAFVRAFLAILVLELEDMVVRLVGLPKLADVHVCRWTVSRLKSAVRPAHALVHEDLPLPPKPPSQRWTKLKQLAGRPICSLAEVLHLERAKKLAHTKASRRDRYQAP